MKKMHTATSTHKYSKVLARSDGYRTVNRGMKSSSQRVARPDVAYSTGKGRQSPANSTVKNCA